MACLDGALAIQRDLGAPNAVARVLVELATAASAGGDLASPVPLLEEAIVLYRRTGYLTGLNTALANLAVVHQIAGDHARAEALMEEGLAIARRLGIKSSVAMHLGNLANLSQVQADPLRAARFYRESLAAFVELGDRAGIAESLDDIAGFAAASGRDAEAAHLLGGTRALRAVIELPRPAGDIGDLTNRPEVLADVSRASYAGHSRGFADFTGDELQEVVRGYYAMVSLIDDEVGRILGALDGLGLAGDTLVVFTSDHGEMLGDHGLLLKGPMLYEGAVRVPLILRRPGHLPQGERRADLVEWIDLCSTFLATADAPPLPGDQGMSLLPLARGEPDAPTRGWAVCEYRDSGHPYDPPVHATMLRRDGHKLVVHHGPPASTRARTGELYDLDADPREERNLWDDPAATTLRSGLERMLGDVLVAIGDRSQPREAFW